MNDKERVNALMGYYKSWQDNPASMLRDKLKESIAEIRQNERERVKAIAIRLKNCDCDLRDKGFEGSCMVCEFFKQFLEEISSGSEVSVNAPLKGQITRVKKGLPAGMQKPEKRTKRFFDDLFGLPRKKEKYE